MIRILAVCIPTLCLVALCLLAFPGDAFAWGPGVHMAASRFVLANLDLLPSGVAALLSQFPQAFLYGSLSADFFVGKGTRVKPGHSHNWASGSKLLAAADTPQLRSYALGYLTHLAADVVAHNFYVPNVLARAPSASNFWHVYVEMQADSRLTGGHTLRARISRPTQRRADKALVAALEKNRVSFMLRKRLFRGSMSVAKLRTWNRSLRLAQRVFPLPDDRDYLNTMFDMALRATLDILRDPEGSSLRDIDPIGSAHLAEVKSLGRIARGEECFAFDPRLTDLAQLPGLASLANPAHLEVA